MTASGFPGDHACACVVRVRACVRACVQERGARERQRGGRGGLSALQCASWTLLASSRASATRPSTELQVHTPSLGCKSGILNLIYPKLTFDLLPAHLCALNSVKNPGAQANIVGRFFLFLLSKLTSHPSVSPASPVAAISVQNDHCLPLSLPSTWSKPWATFCVTTCSCTLLSLKSTFKQKGERFL